MPLCDETTEIKVEIQKATGVVLYSKNYREADIICRVYTKEFGKRGFLIKGLKKSKTRSQAAAEPGAVISMVYYYREQREHQVLQEFKPYRHYAAFRENLDKFYTLCFMLEVVDKTTGFNDPNPGLYALLAAGIETLSATAHPVNLCLFFTLHLLRINGILPDLTRCRVCGGRDYREFAVDTREFLPVCADCLRPGDRRGRLLTVQSRVFVEQSLAKKFTTMDHGSFPAESTADMLFYVTLFIENYFHIRIRSKGMLFSEGIPI